MTTETQKAYWAGYFDGEGCISIAWSGEYPEVRVDIAQKDPIVLQEIARYYSAKPAKHTCGTWSCNFRKVGWVAFLCDVLPYLVHKRVRAELALTLGARPYQRGRKLSTEELALRVSIANKIQELTKLSHREAELEDERSA